MTSRELPVRSFGALPPVQRPGSAPATVPVPVPGADRLRAFADAIVALHQVAPDVPGGIPLCVCGMPARHCPVIRAEHDLLGMPMPFEFGPLARPHYFEV